MKKHMNFVELTKKQQAVIKAGYECTAVGVECKCACSAGRCNDDLVKEEGDGGCMSPA